MAAAISRFYFTWFCFRIPPRRPLLALERTTVLLQVDQGAECVSDVCSSMAKTTAIA